MYRISQEEQRIESSSSINSEGEAVVGDYLKPTLYSKGQNKSRSGKMIKQNSDSIGDENLNLRSHNSSSLFSSAFVSEDSVFQNLQTDEIAFQMEGKEFPLSLRQRMRLLINVQRDIEFISMLANPRYWLQLLDRGYFLKPEFRQYIELLGCYFTNKSLLGMVKYAEGLHVLKVIRQPYFHQIMQDPIQRNRFILSCIHNNLKYRQSEKVLSFVNVSKKQKQCSLQYI